MASVSIAAALARELHDVECAAISAFEADW
jgi:hypothetical protein